MHTREHSNFRRACRTETKGLRDFNIFIQYSQMILYDITVEKWLIQKHFFLKMADLLGYPTHASHITEVKAVHSCALCGEFFPWYFKRLQIDDGNGFIIYCTVIINIFCVSF